MRVLFLPWRSACLQRGSAEPRVRFAYPGYESRGAFRCTEPFSRLREKGWDEGAFAVAFSACLQMGSAGPRVRFAYPGYGSGGLPLR